MANAKTRSKGYHASIDFFRNFDFHVTQRAEECSLYVQQLRNVRRITRVLLVCLLWLPNTTEYKWRIFVIDGNESYRTVSCKAGINWLV